LNVHSMCVRMHVVHEIELVSESVCAHTGVIHACTQARASAPLWYIARHLKHLMIRCHTYLQSQLMLQKIQHYSKENARLHFKPIIAISFVPRHLDSLLKLGR